MEDRVDIYPKFIITSYRTYGDFYNCVGTFVYVPEDQIQPSGSINFSRCDKLLCFDLARLFYYAGFIEDICVVNTH